MTESSSDAPVRVEPKITNNNNGNALLVAVVDQTVSNTTTDNNSSQENYRLVRLPAPGRPSFEQDYLLLTTTTANNATSKKQHHHVMELQSLDSDNASAATAQQQQYHAWFVGNTVVANGKLHVLSRVDPLFWVLASLQPAQLQDTSVKQPWQPLEQLLSGIPPTVQQALQTNSSQMQHLAATYRTGDDDEDEVFYKFNYDKILQWLTKKQQSTQAVLEHQRLRQVQKEASAGVTGSSGGGAFSVGFSLTSEAVEEPVAVVNSSEDTATKKETPVTLNDDQRQQVHYESLQILSNYLTPAWRTALLESHLKLDPVSVLEDPVERQRQQQMARETKAQQTQRDRAITAGKSMPVTPVAVEEQPPPPKPKLSFGQKQLLKVNKKGMKPMTSFFAAKKK